MVAGLSYYLSMKLPGAEARSAPLKAVYDEEWQQIGRAHDALPIY